MGERQWRIKDIIWWPVDTAGRARRAVLPCLVLAGFGALMWTSIAIISSFSRHSRYGYWSILFSILWILIVWGQNRMIPAVAIIGLIFSVWGLVENVGSYRAISDIVMVFLYVQAIRGTFAYKKHKQKSAP